MRLVFPWLLALALIAGCSKTQVLTYAKPASPDRVFGNVKRVAVLPFETLTEAAIGPKNAENHLIQRLLANGTFESVKEPRYVAGLMKKLKLRNAETLDKEIVMKIGQELQVDAVIVGVLLLYGEEEKSKNVEFSISLNMLNIETGEIIWSGSDYLRATTTWGQVFGLSEAPSVNDLASQAMGSLAKELDQVFAENRDAENKIIMKQASEKIEAEEEAAPAEPEPESEDLLLKVKPK